MCEDVSLFFCLHLQENLPYRTFSEPDSDSKVSSSTVPLSVPPPPRSSSSQVTKVMFAFSWLSFLFYELFLLTPPNGHRVPSILPIGCLSYLFRFNNLGGKPIMEKSHTLAAETATILPIRLWGPSWGGECAQWPCSKWNYSLCLTKFTEFPWPLQLMTVISPVHNCVPQHCLPV